VLVFASAIVTTPVVALAENHGEHAHEEHGTQRRDSQQGLQQSQAAQLAFTGT
jgi:hypothetical protein